MIAQIKIKGNEVMVLTTIGHIEDIHLVGTVRTIILQTMTDVGGTIPHTTMSKTMIIHHTMGKVKEIILHNLGIFHLIILGEIEITLLIIIGIIGIITSITEIKGTLAISPEYMNTLTIEGIQIMWAIVTRAVKNLIMAHAFQNVALLFRFKSWAELRIS